MYIRVPMVAHRSCLSVPGGSARMIAKAREVPADEIVIDLEDSVPAGEKAEARQAVVAALNAGHWRAPLVAVRINAVGSRWCHRDIIEVALNADDSLSALIIPKVEGAADVGFVDRLVSMVELESARARPLALELLIETAQGVRDVHEAATASSRVQALIVGYADLAASLGRRPADDDGDGWRWVQETVLVAARAAGVLAIDGPYFEIANLEGLRAWATRTRALGYDGKWALHPTQVDDLNRIFSPTQEEFDRASVILEELAQAGALEGRGAVLHEGEMIDEASRKLAAQVVVRGAAAGLSRR
ncbi:MAG TPA: CoA ester lyase [Solirubrobacteraceae bacterium]|nr:CoA ester lyase [Solirubrobacteraceae bacterium]